MHSFNNNAQHQQQQQQAPPNPLYDNFIQTQANNLLVAAQTQQQLQHHLQQQTQLPNPFAHPTEAQMQHNFDFINNFNTALQQNFAKNNANLKNKAHPYYNKDAKTPSMPLAPPAPQMPHLPTLAAAQKFMQSGQFFPPPFMNPNSATPFDFNQFFLSNMNKNMSAFNNLMQNQKMNPQQHPLNLSQFPHMHPAAGFTAPSQQQTHNNRRQSMSTKEQNHATTSKVNTAKSENEAPKSEPHDDENKDENEDEVLDVEIDEEAHEHDVEDEEDDEELEEENVSISNSSRYDETYHNSSGLLEDEHRHLSGDSKEDAKAPFNIKYDFTFRTLDFSLYGYLKHDNGLTNFAISGLKIPFHSHDEKQSANSSDSKEQKHHHQQQAPKNSMTTASEGDAHEKKSNKSFSIANLIDSPSQHHEAPDSDYQCSTPFNEVNFEKLKFDLPDDLEVRQTTLSDVVHSGLFCKKSVITKGTKFGPYPGKTVYPNDLKLNDDNRHLWEIFVDGRLSHFIDANYHFYDGAPTQSANYWMIFVNCARFAQEQNLIAVQHQGEIFYEVCKDINQGQELLVWYGDSYLQFLGIPVSLKDMTDENNEETVESKDGYTCDRCGKVFAYKYYRDKHLKYTRCVDQGNRKFPCHLCSRSFEKRDRLRIHILHVHEKHRPHKCTVCGKSFSQSSSLNKHMRVHSGERPYKCIYCNKAFTASSILRTHIRQHSGEKPFKCKYCGKAFASHAAHDSHVRRTHFVNKDKDV